ncbi:hypothetical protein D3C86_1042900 [compost metagenome]
MVGVFVVAIGCLGRDAGGLFLGKARFGLGLARVHLDGEGLLGAQHLEQEGQAAEAGDGGVPQHGGGGALYQGREFLHISRQGHLGAAVGVGPHPEFRLGFASRIGDAKQGGEGVMAAPVITLNRILHQQKGGQISTAHKGRLICREESGLKKRVELTVRPGL